MGDTSLDRDNEQNVMRGRAVRVRTPLNSIHADQGNHPRHEEVKIPSPKEIIRIIAREPTVAWRTKSYTECAVPDRLPMDLDRALRRERKPLGHCRANRAQHLKASCPAALYHEPHKSQQDSIPPHLVSSRCHTPSEASSGRTRQHCRRRMRKARLLPPLLSESSMPLHR